MVEELACMTRIFAGNEIGFPEHAQRAKSDVFEIADRRSYDVKSASHYPTRAHSIILVGAGKNLADAFDKSLTVNSLYTIVCRDLKITLSYCGRRYLRRSVNVQTRET